MDPVLLIFIAMVVLLAGLIAIPFIAMERKRIRSNDTSSSHSRVRDVPSLANDFLQRGPNNGSFIAFLTDDYGDDGAASFAQISVERGRVGLDHVFTSRLNRLSADKFEQLMSASGVSVTRRTHDGVEYLRGETDEAPALARETLRSVLECADDRSISVVEEFVE